MKPFTITNNRAASIKWMSWLCIPVAIYYFTVFIIGLSANASTFEWLLNLILSTYWATMGYHYCFHKSSSVSIILNDEGVSVRENNNEQKWEWGEINHIHFSRKQFTIQTTSGDETKLKISHLKYKDIQNTKEKVRKFSEVKQMSAA